MRPQREMYELRSLYERVQRGQEWGRAFSNALDHIDWATKSARFYKAVADMAWSLGGWELARKIVARGLRLYPDDKRLARMAHIIAPPKIIER